MTVQAASYQKRPAILARAGLGHRSAMFRTMENVDASGGDFLAIRSTARYPGTRYCCSSTVMESAMRAILISLLVIGGCESDDAATPEQPASTPTASKQVSTPTAEQPVDDPKPVAKTPDVSPPMEQPLPDVATVKKTLTSAQLAVGDPIANSIGMVLVPIPAGEFMMGSSESEEGRVDNETQHRVTLTKSFHLGRTEVTQGQWKVVMGTTPWQDRPRVKEDDDYAATYVSWTDAAEFCRKLSEKEGVEYRLPTEAEWEYACRAGTTTAYSFGDDESQLGEYAWIKENTWDAGEKYAHTVGQKKPNPWGLYDMHGNMFEWCQDWLGKYPSGDVTDPVGPASGSHRVLRGGGWSLIARVCRSAVRYRLTPSSRLSILGFRVLRSSVK